MQVLIPIAVLLAIVIFFMWASNSGGKLMKEREEKLKRAEKGRAKILGFGTVGLRETGDGGHYQAYNFTLEVSSEYKSSYKTETVWEVFPMGVPKVQEGMEVDVKIDADDPMIVYPSINGVSFPWLGAQMHGKNKKK